MAYIKVRAADGSIHLVEESRFRAFDGFRASGALASALGTGEGYRANDSAEGLAFVVSQLAYTETQVFQRMYTPMQYEALLPISHEAGEWADSIRYEIEDYVGRGKRTSGKGRDINLVDASVGDKSFPVVNGNIGYDYTTEELRRSAFLRRPLSERRMAAAMEGYQRHMNQVGLLGEMNLPGLFNNPVIPVMTAPNGAWTTTNANNPQNILADLNAGIVQVWTASGFNDYPTDIVIAPSRFAPLGSNARSATSDKTILQFLKENNVAKVDRNIDLNITAGYGLDTAGVGGVARMLFYVKNINRLVMHIPLPLRFLAPQLVGLAVEVPGEYKYSGVEVRYVNSTLYMDGI